MRCFYKVADYGMKNSVGYLIRRSSNLLLPQMEDLFADLSLTFSQYTVLMALRDGDFTNAADLARNICHDAGSLTRILDQLEERGLITRRRNAADRREVSLALTARGRALIETVLPRVVDFWNTTLEGFSATEIREMIRLLTRLTAAAEGNRLAEKPRQRNHGRIGRRIHASGPQA